MSENQEIYHYTDIHSRTGTSKGIRLHSGSTIYDEVLLDGHLIGRYWSANGQVLPELNLKEDDFRESLQQFQLDSFRISVEGNELLGGWSYITSGEMEDRTGLRNESGKVRVAYMLLSHSDYPIDVRVCTRLDGSDMIVRWLEITNRGSSPAGLSSVYPMSGRLWLHRHKRTSNKLSYERNEVLDSNTESPFELAYNHSSDWGLEGDLWFEPLKPGEKTFDGKRNGKSGWSRPAFWIRNLLNGHAFVCEFAWSGNWEVRINYDDSPEHAQVNFAIGIPEIEGEMIRVLDPGETVTTPAVHISLFYGDDDSIVQSLHHHLRHVVMPKAPEGRDIEIEANQRGYMRDSENEPGLLNDIDVASEVGVELYVFDAGWNGYSEPNNWWVTAGDWVAGPWLPRGLESICEHVRSHGMKFGLWIELEAIGENSRLFKEHPDWIMKRYSENVAWGRALDLSINEVADWLEADIERLIKRYSLDMLRIDHNNDIGLGGTLDRGGFTENTLWRYYEALYRIFDNLKEKFPNTVFQNCAGGGGRLDYGILQRFHNTEISDWTRQPRGTKIFNGITMALPPELSLRAFGVESGEHVMESDLDFQMRVACICRPTLRGIAPSVKELSPYLKARMKHHLGMFNDFIRPLMRDCLVYHHTPWTHVNGPVNWCVLEYSSPDKTRAMSVIFRLSSGKDEHYILYPRGINRSKKYRVYFDNTAENVTASGFDLLNSGLRIRMPGNLSSELITFEVIN